MNRYDRSELGPGVLGWVYEYVNATPVRRADAMATGLELGVQLAGEWWQRGARSGARLYAPGAAHVLSPAERYANECRARGGEAGVQVGFIVYPDEIEGLASADRDLVFRREVTSDRAFTEFCRAYRSANDRGEPLPVTQARAEVLAFVLAHVELAVADPLARAKREIDRTFTRPLYLEHLAATAGMHPRTFARRFAARYGSTPVSYRLRLRVNEAARLTWAAPELAIHAIAEAVGFDDMPYFHRAFAREFGVTPAVYGHRTAAAAAGSRSAPAHLVP